MINCLRNISVSIFLFLSMCSASPSYATVFPDIWDGTCHVVTNLYIHKNPVDAEKQKGFIPSELEESDSDVISCLPPVVGGPDERNS